MKSQSETIQNQLEFKYIENGSITSVSGIKASGIHCGLKKQKKDLALIYSEIPAIVSGTFTTNKARAASVTISENIANQKNTFVKAIIINSGNANACTGVEGYLDAVEVQKKCAESLNLNSNEILISSTGVIGERLKVSRITDSLDFLKTSLKDDGGYSASEAIMTTDLIPKNFAVKVALSNGEITIGGICKGSGMIMPNMATMLGFLATDARIDKAILDKALREAVNNSFNKISVDGETSTNDMVLMLSNGNSGIEIKENSNDYNLFVQSLNDINIKMAKSIVADGEGATKLVTVKVINAASEKDANLIAKSIANSPLVKTALNGCDPNWGRIISAASSSGANISPEKVSLYFNGLAILMPEYKSDFNEQEAVAVMSGKEITLTIDLNEGEFNTTWWTCDYSEQYIKINAQYRT